MGNKETFYPESRFGGFTNVDGTIAFYSRVNALLEPSSVVLDIGCGRGAYASSPVPFSRNLRILKGKVARVIGVDVDIAAKDNPFIDEFHLIDGYSWPIPDASVDLIVCDFVLEHIPDPDQFFLEISRVLKKGGFLCIRTPNRWSYFALFSALIPAKYHAKILSVVQENRQVEDVFPTVYRCNSLWKLRQAMQKFGFDHVVYGYEAEPSYLAFSKIAYFFGVLHQRFAPGMIKPALFAFGKKL